MIYWIQEATHAGEQGASAWYSPVVLSAGVAAAVVSLFGVLIGQYLQQRRHSQTLEQTQRRHSEDLGQTE